MPIDRDQVLSEIKRIADSDGGKPPGRQRFERETGIGMKEWYGVHWARWGDALIDAGFRPNSKQGKRSTDELLEAFALAVRHFGRVPSEGDLRIFAKTQDSFPGHTTFNNHFGSKLNTIEALRTWLDEKPELSDLIDILPEPASVETSTDQMSEGFVYLLKSGAHFKIGRSDNVEQRVKQISVSLPEEVVLVHSIRTDDPSGIEAYWHRRFADKRAKGEWFKLNPADLRAFKRRKFQWSGVVLRTHRRVSRLSAFWRAEPRPGRRFMDRKAISWHSSAHRKCNLSHLYIAQPNASLLCSNN